MCNSAIYRFGFALFRGLKIPFHACKVVSALLGCGFRGALGTCLLMWDSTDYLWLAAEQEKKARLAIKNEQFDNAWKCLHKQKDYYAKHANRSGFSARDAMCLIGSVDEDLADVLRREGRHKVALLHITFAYATSRHRSNKALEKKLSTYFNRCKFSDSFANFHSTIKKFPEIVDFFKLKNLVDNLK